MWEINRRKRKRKRRYKDRGREREREGREVKKEGGERVDEMKKRDKANMG